MTITVYKLDANGREVWRYPATVLEQGPNSIRLEAFFNRDDMDLGFAIFARGDRFIETFYTDRWYNIFAVYGRDDDQLKGWYCNICRPATISDSAVACDDLALDLWVTPEGAATVLDEDEFAALGLDSAESQQAEMALQELQRLASLNLLPR